MGRKKKYLTEEERIIQSKIVRREYYLKNKIKLDNYQKEYRKSNNDLKGQKWYQKNKERVKEKVKIYQRKRKDTDPIFKLKSNLRTVINNLLRERHFTKKSKTFEIVGCSFEDFIKHIESKFEPWMSWDNYGLYNGEPNYGWDIDHIIPISKAETIDDVIKLNHYSNLQPLCGKTNRYFKRDK